MAVLRRAKLAHKPDTPSAPAAATVVERPMAPTAPRAVKRVTGKAFVLSTPIIRPDDDRTDYRKVVERYQQKVKNPKSAIRAKCVECSGGSLKEVQMCTVKSCALHPFRLGENPHHRKTMMRLARENGTAEAADEEEDDNE